MAMSNRERGTFMRGLTVRCNTALRQAGLPNGGKVSFVGSFIAFRLEETRGASGVTVKQAQEMQRILEEQLKEYIDPKGYNRFTFHNEGLVFNWLSN